MSPAAGICPEGRASAEVPFMFLRQGRNVPRVVSSGVRPATRDSRSHERREEPHHWDGEDDRYHNETIRYHFQLPPVRCATARLASVTRVRTRLEAAFYRPATDRGKNTDLHRGCPVSVHPLPYPDKRQVTSRFTSIDLIACDTIYYAVGSEWHGHCPMEVRNRRAPTGRADDRG